MSQPGLLAALLSVLSLRSLKRRRRLVACSEKLKSVQHTKMRIVFVAAAATAYTSAEPACSSFGAWRVAHGKNYASAAAGTAAERTFAANCGRYAALNALPGGARFGADEWSDLSPGAFAARFGGGLDAAALARGDAAPPVAPAPLAMPPSGGGGGDRNRYVIDWREHGQVTPVKDQGKYGTCWSFGVAQNLEGLGVRQGHTLANVSEQAFISCCPACQGAAATASFSWLVNASGSRGAPALEATYPYAGPVENCTFASAPKAPVRLVSWGRVQVPQPRAIDVLHGYCPRRIANTTPYLPNTRVRVSHACTRVFLCRE